MDNNREYSEEPGEVGIVWEGGCDENYTNAFELVVEFAECENWDDWDDTEEARDESKCLCLSSNHGLSSGPGG